MNVTAINFYRILSSKRLAAHLSAYNGQLVERIYRQHGAALRLFAAQWCRTPDDALQEAMIDLVLLERPPEDPVAWTFRVVRNKAVSRSRSEQRRRRREDRVKTQSRDWFLPDHATRLDAKQCADRLAELPDPERAVIVARVWGELTFEQIGQACELHPSSAYRAFRSGLAKLREMLDSDRAASQVSETV